MFNIPKGVVVALLFAGALAWMIIWWVFASGWWVWFLGAAVLFYGVGYYRSKIL